LREEETTVGQLLEIPDDVYRALQAAARDEGTTPLGWIATHLPAELGEAARKAPMPQNLADLFAGRVGAIQSGGSERLSEQCGDRVTDYLELKRNTGCL
jgi:hypothetical protein